MASRAENTLEGAGTGAATGAVAGSIVPGIGTGIGAGVGAVGGGLYGYFKNKSLSDLLAGSGTNVGGYLDQSRANLANEQGLVGTAANWATTGTGPSAAQAMLGRERAGADQRAIGQAKSMAGGNPALAASIAAQQGGQAQQNAVNQSTILRAQEQQQAMQNALQGSNNIVQGYNQVAQTGIQGDQENAKRKGGFLGGLMSGGLGGVGSLFGG